MEEHTDETVRQGGSGRMDLILEASESTDVSCASRNRVLSSRCCTRAIKAVQEAHETAILKMIFPPPPPLRAQEKACTYRPYKRSTAVMKGYKVSFCAEDIVLGEGQDALPFTLLRAVRVLCTLEGRTEELLLQTGNVVHLRSGREAVLLAIRYFRSTNRCALVPSFCTISLCL